MGNKKNTPAFPLPTQDRHTGDYIFECGMCKRFYAATKIMQGFSSRTNFNESDIDKYIQLSYTIADKLIENE